LIEKPARGETAPQQQRAEVVPLPKEGGGAERFQSPLVPPPHHRCRQAAREGRPSDRPVAAARKPGPARDRQAQLDDRLRQQWQAHIAIVPAIGTVGEIQDPANGLDMLALAPRSASCAVVPGMSKRFRRQRRLIAEACLAWPAAARPGAASTDEQADGLPDRRLAGSRDVAKHGKGPPREAELLERIDRGADRAVKGEDIVAADSADHGFCLSPARLLEGVVEPT